MFRRCFVALLCTAVIVLAAPNRHDSASGVRAEGAKNDPAPIKLAGKGEQATTRFRLQAGFSTWSFTHDGRSNFQVTLLKSDGKRSEMTLNEIGKYNGTQAVRIVQAGEYLVNVNADGKWAITIEQPQPTDPSAVPMSLKGKGPSVSPFVTLSKGIHTFKVTHKGDSTFRVKVLDRDGKLVEQVAAAIGAYQGSKAITIEDDGIYVINVSTKGEWSLKVD